MLQAKLQGIELRLAQRLEERLNQPYAPRVFYFNLILLNLSLVWWQIAADVFKFFIILFADPGNSFNLFFKQRELRSCPFSYYYFKQLRAQVRIFSLTGIGTMVVVAIVTSIATNFFFGFKSPGKAASYGWTQSSWVAGADAVAIATPSNLTNWAKYFLADATISAASEVGLAANSATSTFAKIADFNIGATSSANVVSNGDGSIWLKQDTSTTTFGRVLYSTPHLNAVSGASYVGSSIAIDPVHNKIYAVIQDGIIKFDSGTGGTTIGANWQKFGESGTGSGKFNGPQSVVVDPSRNKVFVSDSSARIMKFDSGDGATPLGSNWAEVSGAYPSASLYLSTTTNKLYGTVWNGSVKRFDSGEGGTTFGANLQTISLSMSGAIFVDEVNNFVYVAYATCCQASVTRFNSGAGGTTFGANLTTMSLNAYITNTRGITVDTANNLVYVTGNQAVVKFSSGGSGPMSTSTAVAKAGSAGGGVWQFGTTDVGIAIDYSKTPARLYLLDQSGAGTPRVDWFDSEPGSTLTATVANWGSFSYVGNGSGQMKQIAKTFLDKQHNKVYVADYGNSRIVRFDSGENGTTWFANWQSYGGPVGDEFSSPEDIFVDSYNHKAYVADGGKNRIVKFDTGDHAGSLGGNWTTLGGPATGNGTNQFNSPRSVYVDTVNSKVYIGDFGNNRVAKFDAQTAGAGLGGNWSVFSSGVSSLKDLAVDTVNNKLYLAHNGAAYIKKLDSGGSSAAIPGTGVQDFGACCSTAVGYFYSPSHLDIDPLNNLLYVGDSNNYRVVKTSSGGAGLISTTSWQTYSGLTGGLAVDIVNARFLANDGSKIVDYETGNNPGRFSASGSYISSVIRPGQIFKDGSLALSWDEALPSYVGSNPIKLQVAVDSWGATPPDINNVPTSNATQYLGVGGVGVASTYAPEIIQLPGGKYRLYYTESSLGYNRLAYRDTVDYQWPNAANLSSQVILLGGSATDQPGHAKVRALPGGGYRLYYNWHDGTHWRLAYRDANGVNPPDISNIATSTYIIASTSVVSTESEYAFDIIDYNGRYRLYFTYVNSAAGNFHQLAYRETSDGDLPNVNNIGSRTLIDSTASANDRGYGPKLLRLASGDYRMYFSAYDGTFWHLKYMDSVGAPPSSADLSAAGLSLNTGNRVSDQAITQAIYQISPGTYRLYFGYFVGTGGAAWSIAYKDIYTFYGPGGTSGVNDAYYSGSGCSKVGSTLTCAGLPSQFNGARSVLYKALLSTDDISVSPSLDAVRVGYQSYGVAGPSAMFDFNVSGAVASGTSLLDSTAYGSNGVAYSSNGSIGYANHSGSTTPFGRYLNFDGVDDTIAFNFSNSALLSNFSIEGWFNTTAQGTIAALYSGTSTAGSGMGVCYAGGAQCTGAPVGSLAANVVDNGTVRLNLYTPQSYNDGQWHHGVFTYDGTTARLYVDGSLATSSVAAYSLTGVNPGGKIGGGTGQAWSWFSGALDEIAIYRRVLPLSEIQGHFNSGLPQPVESGSQPSFIFSSPFDSQSPVNMLARLSWSEVLPTGTDIRFRVRTSAEGSAWTPWLGPDGSSQTWFTIASGTEGMPAAFKDGAIGGTADQFMQYQAALFSDGQYTPSLDDINLTYVVNGPPEARYVAAPTQSATGSISISYEIRDRDTASGTTPGQVFVTLEYCTDPTLATTTCPDIGPGAAWATATAVTGDIGLASVDENISTSTDPIGENSNWTAHELVWLPNVDLPEAYRNAGQFRVRLKIDDNEIVNRYGYATSTTFELDTKKPIINNIAVKADHSPDATIVFDDIVEDTAMEFRLSTDPAAYAGFTDSSGFQALGATTSFDLNDQPTLYAEIRDSRDNRSTTSVTLPDILRMTMIQDTSNLFVDPAEYRLFITWKKPTSSPTNGFDHYNIYRSLANVATSFSLIATGSAMNVNYFTDTEADTGLTHGADIWYIVSIEDGRGNTSYRSAAMWGFADGTQNAGEGGGGTSGVAPRISNVASTTYTTSAAISWDTDTRSDSLVYYQTTESCDFTGSTSPVQVVGVATMLDNAGSLGRHQVTVTGLSPATTYYFQPRSTSPTGVAGMTDCVLPGLSFTTAAGPAIVASSTRVVSVGNSSAEIAWQTDLPADSYVVFSANSNLSGSVELGSSNPVTDHVVTLFGLDPGKLYYFQVKSSNDIDSNQGAYYTFATTQDLTPPTISGITSATTDHSAVIQFATAKAATSTVTLTNDTDPAEVWAITINTLNSNHYFDFSGLSSSTNYTISILARDQNGNAAAATSSLSTAAAPDTAAPVITLPGNFIVTDPTSASISWTTDEQSTSYIQYSTSSVSFETDFKEVGRSEAVTSHSVILDNLVAGTTYYLRVKSTDPSGNTAYDPATPATYHDFQAVAQPLVISSVATGTVTSNSALITYSTNHLADTLILYGTSTGSYSFSQTSAAATTEHAVTLNGLASSTIYYFQVSSVDGLGQGATSSEYSFTTAAAPIDPTDYQSSLDRIDDLLAQIATLQAAASSTGSNDAATIASLQSQVASLQQQLSAANNRGGGGTLIIDKTDKVAPSISDIKTLKVKSDSAEISWLTNESTDGFVRLTDSKGIQKNYGNYDLSDKHVIALDGLLPETKYVYKVASRDASGNLTVSQDQSFTTPTLEAQLTAEGKTDEEIKKLTEEAASKEENKASVLLAAAQKAMEIMSQVANQVSLGTLETTLLTQFDTIEKLAGSIPGPILGGEPLVVTGASTANISWVTDKEASSLVAYAPEGVYIKAEGDNGYLQVVGDANNLTTSHAVRIAGLKPNTTYHYQLRSKAQLGPEAKSRDFTFKTKEEGLEVLTYGSEVKDPATAVFRWSTNLEADTKLIVTPYRSGKLSVDEAKTEENKITTTMHELTAKDLESGVIYEVRLQSKDAKNRLAEEVIEQFTTSKDDLPPQVTNVQTESALSQGKQLKVQTIVSWQTNEPTVGQVQYVKGVVTDDAEFADKTALETTYSRKHVAVVTKFDSGTVYTFRITATDSSGNKTTSKVYTILTPKQKESVFQLILKNFEDIFGWVGQMGN